MSNYDKKQSSLKQQPGKERTETVKPGSKETGTTQGGFKQPQQGGKDIHQQPRRDQDLNKKR
ncbi:MAG: hypothetical protein WAW86_07845 [Gammaproteobacteria bacterium]